MANNLALDLRRCGIGNIVLQAALLKLERPRDAVIVHDAPHELGILDTDAFEITDDVSRADPKLNSALCTLGALKAAYKTGAFRRVVKPIEGVPELPGVQAGFCFRVKIDDLDGDSDEFMNDLAVSTMITESMKYDKVLVVGNDESLLERMEMLHPDAVVMPATNADVRNHPDHVKQWHALSRCPVVYHGVKGANSGLTSTFAPTAAVYGGINPVSGDLIGIDNDGIVRRGIFYSWNAH